MLRKEAAEDFKIMDYEKIYDELMDRQHEIEEETSIAWISSDCYCGDWVFFGVSRYGSEDAIEQIPYSERGHLFSNGDDIDIDIKQVLGPDHPFLKHATFGFYFGTDYT
jgi:hypothetical protein